MGWEDPLEKEMTTHSSILAWRSPRTKEPEGLQFTGSQSRTQLKRLSKHTCVLSPSPGVGGRTEQSKSLAGDDVFLADEKSLNIRRRKSGGSVQDGPQCLRQLSSANSVRHSQTAGWQQPTPKAEPGGGSGDSSWPTCLPCLSHLGAGPRQLSQPV